VQLERTKNVGFRAKTKFGGGLNASMQQPGWLKRQHATTQALQMLHFELLKRDIAALEPCVPAYMQAATGQAH
jgi:hypothetical protein